MAQRKYSVLEMDEVYNFVAKTHFLKWPKWPQKSPKRYKTIGLYLEGCAGVIFICAPIENNEKIDKVYKRREASNIGTFGLPFILPRKFGSSIWGMCTC